MNSGFLGTYVIPWAQTQMDGQWSAPVADISPGRQWTWTGEATRVDGAENLLSLDACEGDADLRARASIAAKRFFAHLLPDADHAKTTTQFEQIFDKQFIATDGRTTWDIAIVNTAHGRKPHLMFQGRIPPKDCDLWIVRHNIDASTLEENTNAPNGVICFTPGTMIATPKGARDIASLFEGDFVQTKDNGVARILWMGHKYIPNARLKFSPDLRPVRLRAGALGLDVPDAALLVSPDHRILLRGARARALFNTDEVLVCARDLVNDAAIIRDHSVGSVHYIHMMLEQHEIVFANGVATESFHPASAALETMSLGEQDSLFGQLPALREDVSNYGGYARRLLSKSDAAILRTI